MRQRDRHTLTVKTRDRETDKHRQKRHVTERQTYTDSKDT